MEDSNGWCHCIGPVACEPESTVLGHSAVVSSVMRPAQPESLYSDSGLSCLQLATAAMSNISLCSCVLQGKARQGQRRSPLCLTLPERASPEMSLVLPHFPVSTAYRVPMVGKQIRAVEVGEKVIKGADSYERLAASRSLFGPMPDAPEAL